MGSGTRCPIGHMKGPATEGWSPSGKKKGNGPKEKKGKKESPTGQPSRNQHKQQNPQAQEEANGASLKSPYRSSKVTSMDDGDSDLIKEQNEPKLSSNGRNNMGEEVNKSMK